jgi:putative ATP-dependent endonuclease of the OLD family
MLLYHLKISHFRGIKSLDWYPNGRLLCLIGPNDATKTTILEAIQLVSLPRYNAAFTEIDFYKGDTANKIVIEATFGDLPDSLLDELSKFGLLLRGYDTTNKALAAAPADGLQKALTVRFELDASLEPTWAVVNEGDEKRITWQDRERLGVNHLGRDIDRHMTWARGSALTRLTDDQAGAPTAQVVATVSREANRVFNEAPKKELNDAAAVVATQAALLGAGFKDLKPGLDVSGLSFGSSAFGLQDANVPARLWGLGTRRIAALAIQQTGVGADSVLLIDEIETGLEPHRVRHLVDCLQNPEKKPKVKGQVIFTTHSPSAVIPLPIAHLRFVRSKNGETTITEVAPEHQSKMQGYVRSYSHALFARKILVCEGATEEGMCRGLLDTWCVEHDAVHPTHLGFVPLNGGGCTSAPPIAMELKRLGYEVSMLGDADEPLNPTEAVLRAAGIPVFLWDGKMATEERITADIAMEDLQVLINMAVDLLEEGPVHAHIKEFGKIDLGGEDVDGWLLIYDEADIRTAIGKAAKKGGKGWFKNISLGISLGKLLGTALPKVPTTPLAKKLKEVTDWIYA